jgi:hypothetical protein
MLSAMSVWFGCPERWSKLRVWDDELVFSQAWRRACREHGVRSFSGVSGARAKQLCADRRGIEISTIWTESLWLAGPVNDAKLVHEYLLDGAPIDFTEDAITLLADGIDGAARPTNAHIHEAFAALAEKAEPGDFVFLHFSGHGSQSPARVEGQEQDGLDELFLPSDISNWDMSTGTIPNALVDDDLGAMINRIIDKGANVWAVFDSCHSGTVTRAGPSGDPLDMEKSRKLGPATLGIPEDVLDAVEPVRTRSGTPAPEAATMETSTERAKASFVYFYAAQTNQTTPEMRLPQGDPDRVSHGLFTFTLFEALAQNPALTYRQLGEEILRRYTAGYRVQPTPLFEGALDNPVFGSRHRPWRPGPAMAGQAGRRQARLLRRQASRALGRRRTDPPARPRRKRRRQGGDDPRDRHGRLPVGIRDRRRRLRDDRAGLLCPQSRR